MPKHIISHSETDDFGEIIAIHCSLEPFDLAFKINSLLGIRLIRSNHDISFKKSEERYMAYSFEPDLNGPLIYLYSNSFIKSHVIKDSRLLFDHQTTEIFLIPELKQADFIIKYIDEKKTVDSFIKSLSLLKEIYSCYRVQKTKIKSKQNLIL